ncbi:MAG: LPXTG cell wall anchor domain-containing protein [Oscillospiraceae bacterium]|nr:LPXTG cell wall anchor domain-containing protein [Oscillospiraceae bacterium]
MQVRELSPFALLIAFDQPPSIEDDAPADPGTLPQTGDSGNPALWLGGASIFGMGLTVVTGKRRRYKAKAK